MLWTTPTSQPALPFAATRLALSLVLAITAAGSGCAAVPPYARSHLAKRCMTVGLGENGFTSQYRAKVIESVTGGGLPGDAPGGGCGCTQ